MTLDPGWSWPSLHEGQRLILADMIIHGERSRAGLARRTGLSRASLTRLSRDLERFGFITERGSARAGTRGRPAEMLHVVPESAHIVGLKLTGEALYAVACNLAAEVVAEHEAPLHSRNVAEVVGLVERVVAEIRAEVPRVAAIGICLAGDVAVDTTGRASVVGSHFLGWDEVPLQSLIEAATGLPSTISNDVQALTTAHHRFGSGARLDSLAVIGYGEGIGAGLVVGGEVIRGTHGRPGKVGHLYVGGSDELCERGHRACVASIALLPRILSAAGERDLEAVLAAAAVDGTRSRGALDRAADALGVVVAQIVNLIDPGIVVITGEGVRVAQAREERLRDAIRARLDPAARFPEIGLVDFRFEDYARGAAVCALEMLVL